MSTHSAIIRRTEDGKYEGIYCHYDGYEDGVGQVLLDHYQDPNKVAALIALGDISSLGERIAPNGPHSYDKREEGTTVAYMRDRGETGCEPRTGVTVCEVAEQLDAEYVYVFENGSWTLDGKEYGKPRLRARAAAGRAAENGDGGEGKGAP